MLKGRTALVTGSTSGIGLGIAQALAQAGANTVLNGLGVEAEIEKIRAQLAAAAGVQVRYNPADMTRPEQIAAMIRDTAQQFGSIDVLVNNAGIQKVAPIDEFPIESWDAILAINLSSSFHTIRTALPFMKARGWGRIVNIASAHGLIASPYKSAYVTAKHGLLGLTKTVALEVAEQGITCNAICPGYVETPLVLGQIKDTALARGISEERVVREVLLGEQPTKRFVSIEEVAALALFLCSDQARSITGAALVIDGGWTAH